MHIKIFSLLSFLLLFNYLLGQNYIGAGNANNITVTTSDDYQLYPGLFWAKGVNTINGSGLDGKKIEATRFLSQATFGGTREEVDNLVEKGIEKWIDEQFELPATYISDSTQLFYELGLQNWVTTHNGDSTGYQLYPTPHHVGYAWWNNAINAKDQLRQRMAYALSEILVVSLKSSGYAIRVADYYDILLKNAFGNYKDLLRDVSLSPTMGLYLSHLNNPKSDTVLNKFPDENYAREIMQLFSVGLYKLNNDGSLMGGGTPIPTYNNSHIKEMAKVFTGFGVGATKDTSATLYFGYNNQYYFDYTVPMKMYDDYHEPGDKVIIDDYVIPAGQTGMEDFEQALDHLFNHPNVAPFVCTRLIQHFVKSNPTPSYINDVATVFNDNGDGIRGDLKAVLKAILLHPEARDCEWINHSEQGKLREPILRYTQFARFFGGDFILGKRYWNNYYYFLGKTDQFPLFAPTVFNFFSPGYTPNGELANQNLVGPEFEIHTTRTSVEYANLIYNWVESEWIFYSSTSDIDANPLYLNLYQPQYQKTDLTSLDERSKDIDALLDELNLYFCNGQLTNETKNFLKNELIIYSPSTFNEEKLKIALYLIMLSPDYVILK